MLVKKICLTGGPSAGKTTALEEIKKHLEEKGYKIYITEEAATNLIENGIKPFGQDAIDMFDFEDLVLCKQLSNEYIYGRKSLLTNEKCVILCDRGIYDVKAYITDNEFDILANKYNLKEDEIINNYDLVIHLVTPAKDLKGEYTLENNDARTESIEEAIEKDDGCIHGWSKHPNVHMVHCYPLLQDKINKILDIVDKELNIKYEDIDKEKGLSYGKTRK